MNEPEAETDWYSRMQHERQATASKAIAALKTLCDQFRALGIEEVRLIYDGYGDSGVIEDVRAMTGGEAVVYSPSEIAIRELQEARMSFNVTRDGTVTITAVAFSPRVATDLANTYVDVLLSRSSSFARQQARADVGDHPAPPVARPPSFRLGAGPRLATQGVLAQAAHPRSCCFRRTGS